MPDNRISVRAFVASDFASLLLPTRLGQRAGTISFHAKRDEIRMKYLCAFHRSFNFVRAICVDRWSPIILSRRITLVLTLLLLSRAVLAADFVGQASVIDGDTLDIHGTRIRLWGVDAPESNQLCRGADSNLYRCGAKAANELDIFIARRPVSCTSVSADQYGRTVATCLVGTADLGEWLVSNGLALDWPRYSHGRYSAAQRDADRSGRGMWAGSYVEPWLYRACIRSGGTPSNCSDDANAHP